MWLLPIAAFGLLVPNGLFFYWLLRDGGSMAALATDPLSNPLAVAFMLDAFMALALLAWLFALKPIGRVRWPWFVVLSLLGGLGFSIPFYLWLNRRLDAAPGADFAAWWRRAQETPR
jgi:hypothetical protein